MRKFLLACLCGGLLLLPGLGWAEQAPKPAEAKAPVETTLKAPQQQVAVPTEEPEAKPMMVPVSFIILDRTGDADAALRREWRQTVRQAYHVPYYTILDDMNGEISAQQLIGASNESTSNLDRGLLAQIGQEAGADVVALMIIHQMDQQMIQGGWHWHDGPNTYIRTYTSADLYIYKKDGDKMLKKVIRDVTTREIGLEEKPERVIKYAMLNLVNKMEGRPTI